MRNIEVAGSHACGFAEDSPCHSKVNRLYYIKDPLKDQKKRITIV